MPSRAKDVFLTMIGFIVDNILIPAGKAFKSLLSKHATSRQFSTAAISTDYLLLISCLHNSFFRIKTKFETVFVPALIYENNELTVCREFHRKSMKSLDVVSSECIHKWIEMSALYNEKLLLNLQSRYDFSPRFEHRKNAGIEPTGACKQLCSTLTTTVQFVKLHLAGESGNRGASTSDKNNLEAILWREVGGRLVASYLSHLRKSKISQEGAFVLVRDLDEYYSVIDTMGCPEVLDMFLSMRDIASVFMAPPENIEAMVTEELRHLDTLILLCLLRARTDFSLRAPWVKQLKLIYPSFNKWDAPFAWEVADNLQKDGRNDVAKKNATPHSLRKVSMEKSALLMPVSRTYAGPGGSIGAVLPETTGGDAKRVPPVKDGVYKMLRTAEENATRPVASEQSRTTTPAKVSLSARSAMLANEEAIVRRPEKKAEKVVAPSQQTKKPNVLGRMASKIEDMIIESPQARSTSGVGAHQEQPSVEKKNNIFGNMGKLFGKK